MTLTLAELQADREAGTKGPWEWEGPSCDPLYLKSGDDFVLYPQSEPGTYGLSSRENIEVSIEDARRIARLPDTEAALIEAVGVLQRAQNALHDALMPDGLSASDAEKAAFEIDTLLAKLGADK